MQKDTLDLEDFDMAVVEIGVPGGPQLETLTGGHLMTEVGASAVGENIFICSCCCCC